QMPIDSSSHPIPSLQCFAVAVSLLTGLGMTANAAQPIVPIPTATTTAYDRSGAPADRDVPFLAWYEDLTPQGYLEEEILMSGTANVYGYADDANQSPEPNASGVSGSYTTRVLVRRPLNAADFNGVVYLEILNATAGYDGAPFWDLTHRSMINEGAAWVGVTYANNTANFMRDGWGGNSWPASADAQPRDNSRYATLNVPTREYTWDILNQAAALLRSDANPDNPMQGFGVDLIITTGYSQSAAYVTTFANSFYPSYSTEAPCTAELAATDSCSPIVDGYIVAAGGPVARLLNGANSYPLGDRRNCENALNREVGCLETFVEPTASDPYEHDLPKIVRFTTESDIKAARVRQTMSDQPLLRTYEAAGTSHVTYWMSLQGQQIAEYQFGIPAGDDVDSPCTLPFNPLRTGIPLSAIQYRLARWIKFDELPPASRYMEWQGDWDGPVDSYYNPPVDWVRDDGDNDFTDGDDGVGDGNALGGVRPVTIGAPLGRYYGSNFYPEGPLAVNGIYCTGIFGGFDAYTSEELQTRYFNKTFYLLSVWWSAWPAWIDGFLLGVDADLLFDEARAFDGLPE
ncbi:MAG: alpha/beta hydrolase domain-containing protein, partial [Gammaproteobacteria bacterium]|nr:alpha/beta hydrolase domain-containing protein [Gammaproteobacteria bacterium]